MRSGSPQAQSFHIIKTLMDSQKLNLVKFVPRLFLYGQFLECCNLHSTWEHYGAEIETGNGRKRTAGGKLPYHPTQVQNIHNMF